MKHPICSWSNHIFGTVIVGGIINKGDGKSGHCYKLSIRRGSNWCETAYKSLVTFKAGIYSFKTGVQTFQLHLSFVFIQLKNQKFVQKMKNSEVTPI